jgi:outer membrane murein-binding lipoprotein Lpp
MRTLTAAVLASILLLAGCGDPAAERRADELDDALSEQIWDMVEEVRP